MRVRAFGRRVSVVDIRVSSACARGESLLGVISIIIYLYLGSDYLRALSRNTQLSVTVLPPTHTRYALSKSASAA
jgi:hypothetical protein